LILIAILILICGYAAMFLVSRQLDLFCRKSLS